MLKTLFLVLSFAVQIAGRSQQNLPDEATLQASASDRETFSFRTATGPPMMRREHILAEQAGARVESGGAQESFSSVDSAEQMAEEEQVPGEEALEQED
eukprot:CAMPEP_0197651324 /NCGR_PEP_ID=MMETSP1338-20131121/31925_1 /TAXON_ID=43686 ORGANISM="Pelagodinium beii, Strain RCC1491" /NCGR_SAMPLE_ID=MMETSP1338 /ASSEMBLY_ACC=CAM_ASM_000754 /LENGTH=98 /DNA_ID=CAMNT_0043225929 /DNA_START=102 /DNA_END=395 /DNA_ORIENTATION=+